MQGCCSIWSFAKLRRDRCLLLRQDRCLLLRQDRYYKVFKHGCALSQQQTSVIQSSLHRRHRSCLSSRQLSCLNSRDASCLYRKHLSCLNKRHMTSVRETVSTESICLSLCTTWSSAVTCLGMFWLSTNLGHGLPHGPPSLTRNGEDARSYANSLKRVCIFCVACRISI